MDNKDINILLRAERLKQQYYEHNTWFGWMLNRDGYKTALNWVRQACKWAWRRKRKKLLRELFTMWELDNFPNNSY